MDLFTLCLKILSMEQQKFNMKLQATDFAQFSNLDANFNLIPMRCGYMYKYGTSTLYFMHDLIKNVFLHPGKSFQISKIFKKWGQCMELKLSSFSPGPGLEIIAFMLALAKDSFLPPPSFKYFKIISKYGAWRNTVNLMLDVIEENTLVNFPSALINRDNVEVIQGDLVSSFTLKVKAGISNSNVILMMKALNIAAENGQEKELMPVLLDFITFLNEDALVFCIDTKPSVSILTKVLSKFPGNYLVDPEHFSSKLPITFPDVYKDFYGSFPTLQNRGAFFVWQKLAVPIASAIPLVSLNLASSNLPMTNQTNTPDGKSECTNQMSPLQNLSQTGSQYTSCESIVEDLKNQCTSEATVRDANNHCTSELNITTSQNQSTFESIVEELKKHGMSDSTLGELKKQHISESTTIKALRNRSTSDSVVGELKEQITSESTVGYLKKKCTSELIVKELKEHSMSESTVEDLIKKPALKSNVGELNNQHTSEAIVELSSEHTSKPTVEDLKIDSTSELTLGTLGNSVSKIVLNSSNVNLMHKNEEESSIETIKNLKISDAISLDDCNTIQNVFSLEAKSEHKEIIAETKEQPNYDDESKHNATPTKVSVVQDINGAVTKEAEKKLFAKDEPLNMINNSNNVKVIDVLLRLNANQSSVSKNVSDKEIKILGSNVVKSSGESANVMKTNMKGLCTSKHHESNHLNEISKGINNDHDTFFKTNDENLNKLVNDIINETKNTNEVIESMGKTSNVSKNRIENNCIKNKPNSVPVIENLMNEASINNLKLRESLENTYADKLCSETMAKNAQESNPGNNNTQQQKIILNHFANGSNNISHSGDTGSGVRKKYPVNEAASIISMKNQSIQTDLISEKMETFQRIERLKTRIRQLTSTLELLNLREKCNDALMEHPVSEDVSCFASKNGSNNFKTNRSELQNIKQENSATVCSTQDDNYGAAAKNVESSISNSGYHCNPLLDLHQSCKRCKFCKTPEYHCRSCAVSLDVKRNHCFKNHENMHCHSSPLQCYRTACCPRDNRMICRSACHDCHNQIQYSSNSCQCLLNGASQCHDMPLNQNHNVLQGNFGSCCTSQSNPICSASNTNKNSLETQPQIVIPLHSISGDVFTQILKLLNQTNAKD